MPGIYAEWAHGHEDYWLQTIPGKGGTRSCGSTARWSRGLKKPEGRERSNANRNLPIPFIAGNEGKIVTPSLMISS